MILCKVINTGDKNLTLETTGRSYLSFQVLEKAIKKQPELFEDDAQYVLITPSKVITTNAQKTVRFETSTQIFPGITSRYTDKKATGKGKIAPVKENA